MSIGASERSRAGLLTVLTIFLFAFTSPATVFFAAPLFLWLALRLSVRSFPLWLQGLALVVFSLQLDVLLQSRLGVNGLFLTGTSLLMAAWERARNIPAWLADSAIGLIILLLYAGQVQGLAPEWLTLQALLIMLISLWEWRRGERRG